MKHKNLKSVLFCRLALLLCGIVYLLFIGIVGWVPVRSADAIESRVDVVVNNAESTEISFGASDPDYDFNLTMGSCQKITRHVTVTTNSPNGYTLYMVGGNTSSFGVDTLTNDTYSTANTDIFKSVTSLSYCSDLTLGNKWGYTLKESASAYTFSPIPTAPTQIATSSSLTGTYPVTVAVGTSDVTAAEYTGSLIFTATTTATPTYFAIYYDYNDGSSGTYMTDTYSGTDASHGFTITSSTPTRSGYSFLGWSLSNSATSASYTSGNTLTLYKEPSSGQYGPVETLYAVWQASANNDPSPTPTQAPAQTSGSQDEGTNANSGYTAPQGVKEEIESSESLGSNGNLVPAIVALTTAAVATGAFIFIIVAKRDKDDDEEEEEGGAQ